MARLALFGAREEDEHIDGDRANRLGSGTSRKDVLMVVTCCCPKGSITDGVDG